MFEPRWRSWLREISPVTRRRPARAGRRGKPQRGCKLALEPLEDRRVMSFVLGTTALLEGPTAGAASDIVVGTGGWNAQSSVPWLHSASKGIGNGLATFTFDANTGATRVGTLTIAGDTLTVTQAGAGSVAAKPITIISTGLHQPAGAAVDPAGNLVIDDHGNNAIRLWNRVTHQVTTLLSGQPPLFFPRGVAVDSANNIFIANQENILELNPATGQVRTIISGLTYAIGVAVDRAGNVYIANFGAGEQSSGVEFWNHATDQVSTIVSATQLGLRPWYVAVDAAGKVYVTSPPDGKVKEFDPATGAITTVASERTTHGAAVDGSGNVFFSGVRGTTGWQNMEFQAATRTIRNLFPTPGQGTRGVTVDPAGNLFYANDFQHSVLELPRAFVPDKPIHETAAAGTGTLDPVAPTNTDLTGPFAPKSDQKWLTVDSVANGVVHFSFTANTGPARVGHLNVLGVEITVTQAGAPLSRRHRRAERELL